MTTTIRITADILDRSLTTQSDHEIWCVFARPNNYTIVERPIDMLAAHDYNVTAVLTHILATSHHRDAINEHHVRSLSRSLHADLYAFIVKLHAAYNG